ncbi:hypothetical protein ACFL2Q_03690 [Thermodesulfobacteriota bacterium]
MGKKAAIPPEIKDEVERIVEEFNEQVLKDHGRYYLTRFRGRFLYLDRSDHSRIGPICRLEYTGSIDDWEFAIFKFSSGSYDSLDWFFPGSDLIDGTVEGAMKAGLEAYE